LSSFCQKLNIRMKTQVYLDNAATTMMSPSAINTMVKWCNMGNSSAGYASASASRAMMSAFRTYIGKLCGVDTCCQEPRDVTNLNLTIDDVNLSDDTYKVIFTSGASEGNSMVLGGVVSAYTEARPGVIPHVVIGSTEHKGIILMAESLIERGLAHVTFVKPDATGHTCAEDVEAALRDNTCLVCVMSANNETGAINDVASIGEVAHRHNIVYHCDTVQSFGKFAITPLTCGVDSFCISFHKFGGPPGVGALVIKQKFLLGYRFAPLVFGTQNEGYRGGTENLPGIASAFHATKINFKQRVDKNNHLEMLKSRLVAGLSTLWPVQTYTEYLTKPIRSNVFVVLFSAETIKSRLQTDRYLPNIVFISIIMRRKFICNSKLKKYLETQGVIVSVGSACNTASSKASHVLYSLDADEYIRKGALRISLGDNNTIDDIDYFISAIDSAVTDQIE
jgi:cysteine desulfurase